MPGFAVGEIQHHHQQHEEEKILVNHDRLFVIQCEPFKTRVV
jgi:hypothetical protein